MSIVLVREDTIVYTAVLTREEAVEALVASIGYTPATLAALSDSELGERLAQAVDDDGIDSGLAGDLMNKADRDAQHSQGDWEQHIEFADLKF